MPRGLDELLNKTVKVPFLASKPVAHQQAASGLKNAKNLMVKRFLVLDMDDGIPAENSIKAVGRKCKLARR